MKVYREALDKKLTTQRTKELVKELEKVYNRNFSEGFYFKTPTNDDFSDSKHGEQTEKKHYIGRIEKYWPKAKSASVKLHSKKLSVGDEIYLISNSSAIKRIKVESIELEEKKVKSAKKGDEIGLFLGDVEAKKGDEIYLILNQ